MMRVNKFTVGAVLAMGIVLLPAVSPPPFAKPLQGRQRTTGPELTPSLRSQILGLPRLWGPPLGKDALEGRVVALTFFASWCGPCRVELALLQEINSALVGRGLQIVAINLFEEFDGLSNEKRLAAFLRITNPDFPVLKGNEAVSAAFGGIRRIPTLIVFDRSGRSFYHFVNNIGGKRSSADPVELRAVIARLL